LLAKYLAVTSSRVVPLARLEELGATPLALVQVMLALEEHYTITIDFVAADLARLNTVEDVMAHIVRSTRRTTAVRRGKGAR